MMRVSLAVVAVLAVLVAGGVAAWRYIGRDDAVHIDAAKGGTARTDDGVSVAFGPGALTADTDVLIKPTKDVPAPAGTTWVTEPVEVTLEGGELQKGATLTMPVGVGDPADAMIVSRDEAGVWTSEGGVADARAGTVTTVVGHFSLKGVAKKVKDVVEMPLKVGGALVSAFKDTTYEAAPPKCDPASQLWTPRTKGDNVKICVLAGTADRPSQLRIVNNRLYGQFLQLRAYPKLKIDQDDKSDLVTNIWRDLAKVNPDYTYLAGKETLDIDLSGGYRGVDFLARPSLEAVIMKVIVDTAKVAMVEAKVAVQAIQCVLATPVFDEVVRERAYKRIPELGKAAGDCVSSAVTGWKIFKDDAPADEEAKARKDRSDFLDAWATAMKDLPTVVETIVQGGFIQRWNTQHVIADRAVIVPQKALNEASGTLPAAVAATQKQLADAAADYKSDRYALNDALPHNGLVFGNAKDQDQKPSLTLGQEPDEIAGPKAAAALALLTSTPPLRWGCPETGRDAYVYGLADPELNTYPGRVTALGYGPEETTVIQESARAARPYRLCIDPDGTWSVFSRNMPQTWPAVDALRIEERKSTYTECGKVLVSAFVPPDAICPTSIRADVDGDGKKDALIVYQRPRHGWTARVVLAAGPAWDKALPVVESYPEVNAVVIGHTDMDGVPGEEAAISVGIGAHSEELVLVSYTKKGLVFVRRSGGEEGADRFTLDESVTYSVGISCADADHDGKPELVEGGVFFQETPYSGGTTSYVWRDKTLVKQSSTDRTFTDADRPTYSKPPYRQFACSWR
jgi:hypothetical protein